MKLKQIIKNYGAVITDVPINWLQWYSGGKFPNPLEFKPIFPKWWSEMKLQCSKCEHMFQAEDADVIDRFVNETKFSPTEYHISYNCPKCKNKGYARQLSIKVFENQMREHVRKHSKDEKLIAAYETIKF